MRPIVLILAMLLSMIPSVSVAALNPSSHCGTERWHIKTLDDADVSDINTTPKVTTVDYLRKIVAPPGFKKMNDSTRYAPVEETVYRVSAKLIEWKQEADHDFHIVIGDTRNPADTMVAEVPDPNCSTMSESKYKLDVSQVRHQFEQCFGEPSRLKKLPPMVVELDGVGFFDIDHGQTGRAKLDDSKVDIELHPILRVKTVEGKCPNDTAMQVRQPDVNLPVHRRGSLPFRR